MKKFLHSRYGASKGAALIIVLALVVLTTALGLAYLTRTTTDRQLAQTSYNNTSADLLARSALDITVGDFKQEIVTDNNNGPVSPANIQPARYPSPIPTDNPNLIRYSSHNDARTRASTVISTAASANGRSITLARWNSHYLIPPVSATGTDSTPVADFTAPDWVLVTAQGPNSAPAPGLVIGRYAFAVYDEGGLLDMNLAGFPTYASMSLPTRPTRRLAAKYPLEESEIILAAFTPNPPCKAPNFSPNHTNDPTLGTGNPYSFTPTLNNNVTTPVTFSVNFLPHGLSIDPSTGTISGTPESPGTFTVTVNATNACGSDNLTLNLTISGIPPPDSTPWPVNLARKGTWAFADLTALPSIPTVITTTTSYGGMSGWPTTTQINQMMGWRNYATTQQPAAASFSNPSFLLANADYYARYFLGAALPFPTPFTTVSTTVQNGLTDQAPVTRQELIRLQRTLDNPTGQFPQSLLQYLGTFSREVNRPAPDWPQLNGHLPARWDMNNLALAIPDAWVLFPGQHGVGHAYGLQKHSLFAQLFGLVWVNGTYAGYGTPASTRFTDPNYYGHWKYIHTLNPAGGLPANPDFFQIIDYAMNQAIGVSDPNHVRNTFTIGAALIDQYDTDDLVDPAPGQPPGTDPLQGNTITIIDTAGNGNFADYVYGIEGMSYDDPYPTSDSYRPPFAPGFSSPPLPANYTLLNRRFENIGEFGYAFNPASSPSPTPSSQTLDFASATSHARALLDFFTYNTAGQPIGLYGTAGNAPPYRAGIVNLNTRNAPVLASIISGAWVQDPGAQNLPSPTPAPATVLVSRQDALAAGQAIVAATTAANGAAVNRADAARLAGAAFAAMPDLPNSDQAKKTIARALAEVGQARTWNLMIDVIAQTGNYAPGTPNLNASKFIVQGEKRYWLHIALDRDSGTVLGTQLEEVLE